MCIRDRAGDESIRDLERTRDGCLVAILRGLEQERYGAGETLHSYRAALHGRADDPPPQTP